MIKINGKPIEINYFPDGTQRLNNIEIQNNSLRIEWLYEPNEEMVLYYVTKHIKENWELDRSILTMPYLPNGRMDRTKSPSEVFTLKYFCQLINSLKFDEVWVKDAHSNVGIGMLNNVFSMDIKRDISSLIDKLNPLTLFFPDEGSMKRYSEVIKYPHIFGIKKRDWETGEIKGLDVFGDVPKEPFDVLIIDDISSYGGTFLHSAKKLKELGANKIWLYVTHCENSILDGELINSGLIEKIYTTNSIFTKEHPLIEIIGG